LDLIQQIKDLLLDHDYNQRIRPDDQNFFEWLLEAPALPDDIIKVIREL
jgi:hypothetical protein